MRNQPRVKRQAQVRLGGRGRGRAEPRQCISRAGPSSPLHATSRARGPKERRGWGVSRGQSHPFRTLCPQSAGGSQVGRGRRGPGRGEGRIQDQRPRVLWERALRQVPAPHLHRHTDPSPDVHRLPAPPGQGLMVESEDEMPKNPRLPLPALQPQKLDEQSPGREVKLPEHSERCGPFTASAPPSCEHTEQRRRAWAHRRGYKGVERSCPEDQWEWQLWSPEFPHK